MFQCQPDKIPGLRVAGQSEQQKGKTVSIKNVRARPCIFCFEDE